MTKPLQIERSNQFKRDYKKAKKQGKDLNLLHNVIENLCYQRPLSEKFRDHSLSHNWSSYRELHLSGDWLLIYRIIPKEYLLQLSRLGSHAELFNM
jgi:mRNA interferase YafQ